MWKKNCVECMGNVQHSFLAWFSAKMPLFEIFALAIEINDTIKKTTATGRWIWAQFNIKIILMEE